MKNIRVFLSENFQFLEVKFSIYMKRFVFVMYNTFWKLTVGMDYLFEDILSIIKPSDVILSFNYADF